METTNLRIDQLRRDGGTQPRAALDEATVAEYAEADARGDVLPPVTVFFDGKEYWLADGFHRAAARERAGRTDIVAEVRQGDRRAAVLHSTGVNAEHGLRRSNADKRRAVETLLSDPEWGQWSDREIARRVRVGHQLVSLVRGELSGFSSRYEGNERTVTRGGTTYTVNTEGIATANQERAVKASPPAAPEPPAPAPERPYTRAGYAPIWQIEQHVRDVLAEAFPDPLERVRRLEDLKARTPQGEADFEALGRRAEERLSQRCAAGDVRQACHNVLAQLKQELERQAAVAGPSPAYSDLREQVSATLLSLAQGDPRTVQALVGQIKIMSPQGMDILAKLRDRLAEVNDPAPRLRDIQAVCVELWLDRLGLPRPAAKAVVYSPTETEAGSRKLEADEAESGEELRLNSGRRSPGELTTQGRCTVCGRPLSDPAHVAQGCGPVCAGKASAKSNGSSAAPSLSGGFVFGGQQESPAGAPELLASIERQALTISRLKTTMRTVVRSLEKVAERDEEPATEIAEAIFALSQALLAE